MSELAVRDFPCTVEGEWMTRFGPIVCKTTTIPEIRIVRSFDMKPIPLRSMDWCAMPEGCEEEGPYGWGATEFAAIHDLMMEIEAESDHDAT